MSCKCSKTILEGPLVERCRNQMKVNLKEFKENSKSKLSWKITEEFEQGVKCLLNTKNLWKGWGLG
jgi:hypothetical protein